MKTVLDLENPFFAPVWIRATVVGVTSFWGLVEFTAGQPLWAMMFIALSAFCAYRFKNIDYNKEPEE